MLNELLDDAMQSLKNIKSADERADAAGRLAAKIFLNNYKQGAILLENSHFLAAAMDELSSIGSKEYTSSLIELTISKYWAFRINPIIPRFHAACKTLRASHTSEINALSIGDYDYSLWAESDTVMVSKCNCAARDDNTYIFILEDKKFHEANFSKFHARSCWQKLKKRGKYIEHPTLKWYQARNFTIENGNFNDPGYAFTYDNFNNSVERADLFCGDINSALWVLFFMLDEIENDITQRGINEN